MNYYHLFHYVFFRLLLEVLKLFDLKKCEICEDLLDMGKRNIWKIEGFLHPLYGNCLITQYSGVNIELWKQIDNINICNNSK